MSIQVDCLDELRRVSAAEQIATSRESRYAKGNNVSPRKTGNHPPLDAYKRGTPAVLIRLPYPVCPKRAGSGSGATDANSTGTALPADLEVAYGASIEEAVEIAQAVAATARVSSSRCPSPGAPGLLPVVGFSIDVGAPCLDDAIKASGQPAGSAPGENHAVAPGEAVASASLTRTIEAAVLSVVGVARRIFDAMSVPPGSKTGVTAEATQMPSPSGFSFRRLHVTGLGHGGARGEPLAALEKTVARHLAEAGFDDAGDARSVGRPVTVSADATEHLMAGGVWSTVASIIGRKDAHPSNGPTLDDGADGPGTEALAGGFRAGPNSGAGAMYYIDDGCYGSLSGALLRGVPLQPVALSCDGRSPWDATVARDGAASGGRRQETQAGDSTSAGTGRQAHADRVPCTVWGPTCDGLDCVARLTPLPTRLQPGRDWLFFPERGMRSTADATGFNGLAPLSVFYCVRAL